MTDIETRPVTLTDGTQADGLQIPDDVVLCLIPKHLATGEWTECCAIRIIADSTGTIGVFQVTNDLEWVTGPEATS